MPNMQDISAIMNKELLKKVLMQGTVQNCPLLYLKTDSIFRNR